MNTLSTALISSLALFSLTSVAAEEMHNNLIIQAVPYTEGTVVVEGQPKYEKTFRVVIYTKNKKPVELTRYVGCYKAFDEKGKEFDERSVQEDLVGTLQSVAKEGLISFVSDDVSVYNAKFVKWSKQCPNQAKHTQ